MATIQQTVVTKVELDNSDYIRGLENQEDAQEDANKATEEGAEATQEMEGALGGVASQLGINIGALSKTTSGIKKTVKGFKSMKFAIAALGIGALIIAVTSLLAWFNRTSEGQEKLAIITRTVGEVFNQLVEIAVDVGEAIFTAFENPKQAVIDLWEAIKKNIVNRVTALPDVFVKAFKIIQKAIQLDFAGAKEELESLAKSVVQLTTGLDEAQQQGALDFIANKTKEIKENVQAATALQKEANDLRREQIAFITQEAQLITDIAAARLLGNDASKTSLEQLAGINQAVDLTNNLFAKRGSLLSKEIEQLKTTQALGSNTLEDNEELARLQAQLINLNAQRDTQLKSLAARQGSLNNAVQKEAEGTTELVAAKEELIELDQSRIDKALSDIQQLEFAEETRRAKEVENEEEQARLLIDIEARKLASLLENEGLYLEERNALIAASDAKQSAISAKSLERKQDREDQEVKDTATREGEKTDILKGALAEFAKNNKAAALVNAGVNIAEGITAALGLPFPANIAEGIRVALVGASQISAIRSKKFALGGMLRGARHSAGGIDINAEDGEVIITRNAVAKHLPLLSAINQDGGGIPLAARGMLVGQAETKAAISGLAGSIDSSLANNAAVLVTEDLDAVQNRVDVTENISTL